MRIVAGRFRGRTLQGPDGNWLRPTADRMKESIYNVLQGWFPGARVLDLFAGSGNLGLEALSRGARRVVLVERSPRALRLIRHNLETLAVHDEVEVVREDALVFVARASQEPFDVILADPPYDQGFEAALVEAMTPELLAAQGCFVLQRRRTTDWGAVPEFLRAWRTKRFGDTHVDFLLREEDRA